MKQVELIEKRKPREKHFLQEDGTIIAEVYDDDIHFLNENKFEEIDNTLIEENGKYVNKSNSFKVFFNKEFKDELMKVELEGHFLNIRLGNKNKSRTTKIIKCNQANEISYENAMDNIDLDYKVMSTMVKESIIIKNRSKIPTILTFLVESDLTLNFDNDKNINAIKDGKNIFTIESPYMIDAQGNINNNVYYKLSGESGKYSLDLVLDSQWLNNADTMYPVTIDPTITQYSNSNSCYDTYIYPGDTNVNRNNHEYLKAGVEMVNGSARINRALLKFDLPTIGTGSQIIKAELKLVGYPIVYTDPNAYHNDIINIHRITSNWTETGANWNNMNANYDPKIEGTFKSYRSIYYTGNPIEASYCGDEITSLVKKWYSSDLENYGIMLKMNTETYHSSTVPMFYSKNHQVTNSDPKPILRITYRNQNGLENYMHFKTQKFSQGMSYVNSYNGNLVAVFDICETVGGKLPALLKLVYNTNDVVLQNNVGCGMGYMFNYNQTIKKESIDGNQYLSYVDADGTIHYFYEKENIYKDEDGLNLKIEKSNGKYILTEKNGNTMSFTIDNTTTDEIGFLTEINDLKGNTIHILYANNLISKIIDANNQEIIITYGTNIITIVSPDQTIYLDYSNNKLTTIRTIYGNTLFTYNSSNVISKITDPTGLSFTYDYYSQSPYRLKKVTQYGLNNEEGRSFDIEYNFNSTTFTENNQKVTTLTFNNSGNLVSMSNLKSSQDLTDAYGIYEEYGESYMTATGEYDKYKNKILSTDVPFKYIKNYLSNSSFEANSMDFQASSNVALTLSTDFSEIGLNSLKIVSSGTGTRNFFRNISVPKGKYYTFSGYFKNENNLKLSMYYLDSNSNQIFSEKVIINPSDDFSRYDVSLYYPENATSNLYIFIEIDTNGTSYLDCVQLEEGEVANYYNMLENSDFSNGFNNWSLRYSDIESNNGLTVIQPINNVDPNGIFEIVDIGSDKKAIKVNMNPKHSTEFEATLDLKGKKDESYNISFWYKNKGLPASDVIGDYKFNNVSINFNYTEEILPHGGIMSKGFNPNDDEWQYFQTTFIAEENFDELRLNFFQYFNANEIYITNLTLIKSYGKIKYDYDDNGNIIDNVKSNDDNIKYKYDKNNQMVKAIADTGTNITNEYDNIITDRILKSISPTGLVNENIYDEFGNICLSRTTNYGKNEMIETGDYRIRLKGTYNYIGSLKYNIVLSNPNCNHYVWKLIKTQITEQINGETVTKDVFKIKHPILNKYMKTIDNALVLSSDYSLFELVKNDNGSFYIIDNTTKKYIKNSNNEILLSDLITDDYTFEFYFENTNKLFFETCNIYSTDGKFVTGYVDSLMNKTVYNVNNLTGLVNSISNPYGIITSYSYDNKRRLSEITQGNRTINYSYNSNNALQSITCGNRQYNYDYDNFLNVTKFKIGNISLINNSYEQKNGNLVSSIYGNNNQISFLYDEFDRLKTKQLMNDVISYQYGDNNNLLKVKSNYDEYRYVYDLDQKIREFRSNNFKIKYDYNSDNNISSKKYIFGNDSYTISNTFVDGNIVNSLIENAMIDYSYDYLGRLTEKSLNNSIINSYSYVKNGNRTSLLIRDNVINNDLFSYRYNKLDNITHVYKNNNLINKYSYNNHSELLEDFDYNNNRKTLYEYDTYGNILSKKIYNLSTNALISQNIFEYNNSNWVDLLTKVNNEYITYDSIGNPLTIGNKSLTWINGRQLNTYSDGTNNISYKYNMDGIRIEQNKNNVVTNYYLENNKIVAEKTGNNYIIYIYDGCDSIIGFKYNNNTYFYLKNIKEDIIGILDSNYNIVARYEYDAYGKILSITDSNNNSVISNINHIANINPFRYRSYYYDVSTGFYYLNTRYYNPEWGRFINADGMINITTEISSYNLFTYCNNNPVNLSDSVGNFPFLISLMIKGLIAGAIGLGILYLVFPAATEMLVVDSLLRRKKSTYTKNDTVVKEMMSSQLTKDSLYDKGTACRLNEPSCKGLGSIEYYNHKSFRDYDLHLSAGQVWYEVVGNIKMEMRPGRNLMNGFERRYIATIKIVDEYYDFPSPNDEESKNKSWITNRLNAFGYKMTKMGVLSEYNWDATFTVVTDWR